MIWALVAAGSLAAMATPDFSAPLKARGEKGGASVATLTSDGQQLVLDVDVVDTTPSAAKDDVHSDHVEVWLGLEDLEAIGPTRFVTASGGKRLFTVRGKDTPAALDAVIRGKDTGMGGSEVEKGCEESVRMAHDELGKRPSKRVRAFFGLAHLGFFPDGRPPVLYDRELYAPTKLSPSLGAGDVRYEARKTERGYHVRAWLQPGALLFVPRDGLRALRVRVDAIDAGGPGAREVLRSTHPAPGWGEPATLEKVELAQPLPVKLLEALPELGRREPPPPGAAMALDSLPRVFMRTGTTWQGVDVARASPTNYYYRNCPVELTDVTEHTFKTWDFGPATPFNGGDLTRVAAGPGALLTARLEDGLRAAFITGKTPLGFRFQDGTPGVVREETSPTMGVYTSGMCGATDSTELTLVRLDKSGTWEDDIPLLEWGGCSSTINFNGRPVADLMDGDESVKDEGDATEGGGPRYTWVKPGERLRVSFGGGVVVEVGWKPDGSGLEVSAQPPMENP